LHRFRRSGQDALAQPAVPFFVADSNVVDARDDRPRVRAPEGWNLPVGLSLSAEIGCQRRAFSSPAHVSSPWSISKAGAM